MFKFWKRGPKSDARRRYDTLLKRVESRTPVSELLASAVLLAKVIRLSEFEKWVALELNGYHNSNAALTDDVQVPRYRYIPGQRVNEWGQEFVLTDPGLQFVNEYPMREGAEALEGYARKHGVLRFRDALGAKLVEEHFKVEGVAWFRFGADSLGPVLSAMRARLIEWLHDPRIVAALSSTPVALRDLAGGSAIDQAVVNEHLGRILHGLDKDPAQAIGSAKELAETVARHVLLRRGQDPSRFDTFPRLLKAAIAALDLGSEPTTDAAKASPALAMVTGGLGQVAEGTATLRNLYGTGHGRVGRSGADRRHARLVVGACATLANFLIETLEARP